MSERPETPHSMLDSDDDERPVTPRPADPARDASAADNVVVCRSLFNPEQSVLVPASALGLRRAPRSGSAGRARRLLSRGTDVPPPGGNGKQGSARIAKPRQRDSSSEDGHAGDEKRFKSKPLSPASPPPAAAASTAGATPHASRKQRFDAARALPSHSSLTEGASGSIHSASPASSSSGGPANITCDSSASDYSDSVERRAADELSPSTSYAGIEPAPPTPPAAPAASYAAVLASPPPPRTGSPPTANTQPASQLIQAPPGKAYPPIMVDNLPDWPAHLREIRKRLGHIPSARPLDKGIKFMPRTPEEFRGIQKYLIEAAARTPDLSWWCYDLKGDRPLKMALWGLPRGTDVEAVTADLKSKGFPARFTRALPTRKNTNKCVHHVQFDFIPKAELDGLYKLPEVLGMPGVYFEAWKGRSSMPQCHRCQAFGHSSAHCHRPQRCVKCAGPHFGSECDGVAPTLCANCRGPHQANSRTCALFRREARRRKKRLPGAYRSPQDAPQRPPPPLRPDQWAIPHPACLAPLPAGWQAAQQAATARLPAPFPPAPEPAKNKKRKKRRRRRPAPAAQSTPVVSHTIPASKPPPTTEATPTCVLSDVGDPRATGGHLPPASAATTTTQPARRKRRGRPRRRQPRAPAGPAGVLHPAPPAIHAAAPVTAVHAAPPVPEPYSGRVHATRVSVTAGTYTAPIQSRPGLTTRAVPAYGAPYDAGTHPLFGSSTQGAPRLPPGLGPQAYAHPAWQEHAGFAGRAYPGVATSAAGEPMYLILGALSELLAALVSGEDVRVAAARSLATLRGAAARH